MTPPLQERLQKALGDAYTLERELVGGGMSRVFVARDKSLGRLVVVKVLPEDLAAAVSIDRFEREVRLAARLSHPHVVPLLSAGAAGDVPYYTMPYVTGESLRSRLGKGVALPVPEAVSILRDVAKALAYAHAEGVVHRDIKPENILLSAGSAAVTDFGIAKALSAATGTTRGTLTGVGVSVGTPAYMAPEQALGDPLADHRADIYAWGCVAYELLCGEPPFGRQPASAQISAHVHKTPQPIGARVPKLPEAFARLVTQCLSKDPADRPQSADALVHALDNADVISGSHGFPARRRTFALATGVIAALVIVVAGSAYWMRARGDGRAGVAAPGTAFSEPSIAVLPFTVLGGDSAQAYFAVGIADELITALSRIPVLRVASRLSAFALPDSGRSILAAAHALHVSNVVTGSMRRDGLRLRINVELTRVSDGTVLWSERYERKLSDVFAVQDEISRAIADALRTRLATADSTANVAAPRGTNNLVAYDQFLRGRYLLDRRGGAALEGSIRFFRAAVAQDPGFARAYAGISMAAGILPRYGLLSPDSARALQRTALESADKAVQADRGLAEAHAARANALMYFSRRAEGFREYEQAIALDPKYAVVHQWYGMSLAHDGRLQESCDETRHSSELDPLSAINAAAASYDCALAGRNAEALALAHTALALDANIPTTRMLAGYAIYLSGDATTALANLAFAKPLPEGLALYAIVAAKMGQRATADSALHAIELQSKQNPAALGPLAMARAGLGDVPGALTALKGAAERGQSFFTGLSLADPAFDSLRGNPAFTAVVHSLNLNAERLNNLPRRP